MRSQQHFPTSAIQNEKGSVALQMIGPIILAVVGFVVFWPIASEHMGPFAALVVAGALPAAGWWLAGRREQRSQ